MSIKIDMIEIGKQGRHLRRGQLLPRPHHTVTGNEEEEGIEGIFNATADPEFTKIAGEIVQELGKIIPPGQELRHGLESEGAGAEELQLKTETT
jgi:hypothetical protein